MVDGRACDEMAVARAGVVSVVGAPEALVRGAAVGVAGAVGAGPRTRNTCKWRTCKPSGSGSWMLTSRAERGAIEAASAAVISWSRAVFASLRILLLQRLVHLVYLRTHVRTLHMFGLTLTTSLALPRGLPLLHRMASLPPSIAHQEGEATTADELKACKIGGCCGKVLSLRPLYATNLCGEHCCHQALLPSSSPHPSCYGLLPFVSHPARLPHRILRCSPLRRCWPGCPHCHAGACRTTAE